jgi:hypothetical protein
VRHTYRVVTLKENHAAAFIACSKVITRMVELDCRNDIRWKSREWADMVYQEVFGIV